MTGGIADTTVIVDINRRLPAAHAWFAGLSHRLAISPLTEAEIIVGAPDKASIANCQTILDQFDRVYLTTSDMQWAVDQLAIYHFSHGIGLIDCFIAAPCYRLRVPLYTHNLRHMTPLLGSLAIKPY
ncbi:MAG: hypothetical protein J0M33_22135 [Anaerolineae bacterium]|nr:hypothetical protein [Anaerolineae bacterium]